MSRILRPTVSLIDRGFRRAAAAAAVAALIAFACPALSRAADSAQNAPNARGEKIFNARCVFCHGVGLGHPGWQMLALKKGPAKAEILGRSDLTQAYIEQVVRDGNIEMPPFRPSEISNADLNALAEYVIHPNGDAGDKCCSAH
jgi:mono/diheme cytochrome c family protein